MSDIEKIAARLPLSADTLKRNPQWINAEPDTVYERKIEQIAGNRVRQSGAPRLNKLELSVSFYLAAIYPGCKIHSQSFRVEIANGSWFKVDHMIFWKNKWMAFECKGPKEGKNVARGILALKVTAGMYPEIEWYLIWKENGQFKSQHILNKDL